MKLAYYILLISMPVLVRAQIITTVAGTGTPGFSGDGGQAFLAQLNQPSDVFKDASGNLYIADYGNNRIRKINTSGIITTIAGNGSAAYTGDDGPATAASLNHPNRVFADNTGTLYIADQWNNVIRMVNSDGIITTIAGTGAAGFSGDGGQATDATLDSPTAVAVDYQGNMYIADLGNFRIRKVSNGIITTYAGGGAGNFSIDGVPATSIELCGQNYVSIDYTGTIYITNHDCWRFLKVTPDGLVYNVAGNTSATYSGDGGPADSANIEGPYGICPDNLGNVYLCARENIRVRKVNAGNIITTVAGTGTPGYSGDGGPATAAEVSQTIHGVFADRSGNVYFADKGNNRIRLISSPDTYNTFQPQTFIIYPNPTARWLNIASSGTIYSVRMYDIPGQTLYNRNDIATQSVTIDVSALATGMYFVCVNDKAYKFVKE